MLQIHTGGLAIAPVNPAVLLLASLLTTPLIDAFLLVLQNLIFTLTVLFGNAFSIVQVGTSQITKHKHVCPFVQYNGLLLANLSTTPASLYVQMALTLMPF